MQTRDTQNGQAIPEKLYPPREAAALLGVTVKTLQRWSDAGQIHAHRTVGGARRFPKSEIDRILRGEPVEAVQ